jgi:alanyl-tRNA synthetase
MQYNRKASGKLEPLPAQHVDTGMGFERLCRIVQQKNSNYDIDLFQQIITVLAQNCGMKYGDNQNSDVAMRVVVDHLRAISFSIADGQIPSNNKAGYVIRRLLRRAVRYGYTFLQRKEPFMCALVPVLVNVMGDAYPELKTQQNFIERVIKEEEISFLRRLSTGISLLEEIIADVNSKNEKVVSGKIVFEMYDTYGFPLDLTELILRENGLSYNHAEYQTEMEAQKNRSRAAAAVDISDWVEVRSNEETIFIGYDALQADISIMRYRKVVVKDKTMYQLVFDITPFYAEGGGQAGDSGYIKSENEQIQILNTKKENNLIIHLVENLPNNIGGDFTAFVNKNERLATEVNHTATHLLHLALREVLGEHVEQKGSSVNSENLRFDFSHFQKLTEAEIRQVEQRINQLVRENITLVEYRDIPTDDALKMGAIALFGEKYDDKVRAIKFGQSIELCGGTHANATGQIGIFKIISESAISAGVRRIEAITANKVEQLIYANIDTLKQIRELFNNSPTFLQSIRKSLNENQELKKQLEDTLRERIQKTQQLLIKEVEEHNGINVIKHLTSFSPDIVKGMISGVRTRMERLVIIVGCNHSDKPMLTVAISDDLIADGKNASTVVREAAKEMNGNGGGQPFLATASGKNPDKLEAAMAKALELLV